MSKTNIELHIVLLNGDELFIDVLPQDTILKLKELIQEEMKEAASDMQSLTFKGKELKNEDTIQSYENIKDGTQLVLTFHKDSYKYRAKKLFDKAYQLYIHNYEEESYPLFLSSIKKGEYLGSVGYCLSLLGNFERRFETDKQFKLEFEIETDEEFVRKHISDLLSIENSDDPDILFSQGYCYQLAYGVAPWSYPHAFDCFNKAIAIDSNHVPALETLGRFYYYGLAVTQDLNKSIQLFRKAAKSDYLPAMFGIAFVLQDYDEIRYWGNKWTKIEKEIMKKKNKKK